MRLTKILIQELDVLDVIRMMKIWKLTRRESLKMSKRWMEGNSGDVVKGTTVSFAIQFASIVCW